MGTWFLILALYISRSIACSCSSPLKIGQFNVGQEPFQPFKTERLDSTIRFINENSDFGKTTNIDRINCTDILCMQELWSPNEKQLTIDGIASKYPHTFSPPTKTEICTSSCSSTELNSIVSCATHKKCQFTVNIFDFIGCLHRSCDNTFADLSDTCQECIIDPFHPTIHSKLTRCAGFEEKYGLLSSCTPLFNGTSDTLIASKYPLIEKDYLQFEIAPEAAWSTIYGKIKHPTFGHVNLFCSHLVAGLSLVDFSKENFYESNELLQFVQKKVGNSSEIVVLAGDFNSGPVQENLSSYFPQTYDNIVKNGFTDTTVKYFRERKDQVPCTSCGSNPLSSAVSEENNKFTDHIFINENLKLCISDSGRFATENIVNVIPTANFNVSMVPLSDHFGIYTTMCPSKNQIGSTSAYTPYPIAESSHKAMWGGMGIALVVLAVGFETWIMRAASGAPLSTY